jgi:hypothetical protein
MFTLEIEPLSKNAYGLLAAAEIVVQEDENRVRRIIASNGVLDPVSRPD